MIRSLAVLFLVFSTSALAQQASVTVDPGALEDAAPAWRGMPGERVPLPLPGGLRNAPPDAPPSAPSAAPITLTPPQPPPKPDLSGIATEADFDLLESPPPTRPTMAPRAIPDSPQIDIAIPEPTPREALPPRLAPPASEAAPASVVEAAAPASRPPPPPPEAEPLIPELPPELLTRALDEGEVALLFNRGDAAVNEQAADILAAVSSRLRSRSTTAVRIIAYAEAGEGNIRARQLSFERGLNVRRWLMEAGVRAHQIRVSAKGAEVSDGPADRVDMFLEGL